MFNFDLDKKLLSVEDVFDAGMDRSFGRLIPVQTPCLNLGAGNKKFPWAMPLGLPEWDAEKKPIPAKTESFHSVLALHFFEHISPARFPFILSECERVLIPGGTITAVVPHRLGTMAYQDIDHKIFFTEHTIRILLHNGYYKTKAVQSNLRINVNMIFGECEKSLALLFQLVKEK